ncbi:MAG: GIY-YIG nuclease family protein [Candidatus Helarchaeota archaeon]|nr:GIY-YIG nuclease family protein [Candidatus Helarchaeota archaeon]
MTQGVYALIIENRKEENLQIGKLGTFLFPKGYYVYIGSALGSTSTSLEHRLKRHLSSLKKLFWHIDYLLNSENIKIISILSAPTPDRKECELASAISRQKNAEILISHFGASDCQANCGAHLFYFTLESNELIKMVKSLFSKINLNPVIQPQ